jgi:hypothetical protein
MYTSNWQKNVSSGARPAASKSKSVVATSSKKRSAASAIDQSGSAKETKTKTSKKKKNKNRKTSSASPATESAAKTAVLPLQVHAFDTPARSAALRRYTTPTARHAAVAVEISRYRGVCRYVVQL